MFPLPWRDAEWGSGGPVADCGKWLGAEKHSTMEETLEVDEGEAAKEISNCCSLDTFQVLISRSDENAAGRKWRVYFVSV